MVFFVTPNKKKSPRIYEKKDRTIVNLKFSNLKSLNTESKLVGWAKISSFCPADLGCAWQEEEEDPVQGKCIQNKWKQRINGSSFTSQMLLNDRLHNDMTFSGITA